MKLSEKIINLRKANGMTQEELAAICNVSRQSISKWEADIALPETEKLLILGDTFRVSMDILLKDELTLSEAKDVYSCSSNAIHKKKQELYEGILIKESIADDSIIDCLISIKLNCGIPAGNQNTGLHYFLQVIEMIFQNKFQKSCCLTLIKMRIGLLILRQVMKNTLFLKTGF